jgi:hypothetical protein
MLWVTLLFFSILRDGLLYLSYYCSGNSPPRHHPLPHVQPHNTIFSGAPPSYTLHLARALAALSSNREGARVMCTGMPMAQALRVSYKPCVCVIGSLQLPLLMRWWRWLMLRYKVSLWGFDMDVSCLMLAAQCRL